MCINNYFGFLVLFYLFDGVGERGATQFTCLFVLKENRLPPRKYYLQIDLINLFNTFAIYFI